MRAYVSIAKHPLHPMLVVIPLGLWTFSLLCDIVWLFDRANANWPVVAYYCMAGGMLGALVAAVPGLSDLLSLTDERLRQLGRMHLAANLIMVALYAVNIVLRTTGELTMLEVGLSFVGVTVMMFSGWLGAELVHVHGVGVEGVKPAEPRIRMHLDSRPGSVPTKSGSSPSTRRPAPSARR